MTICWNTDITEMDMGNQIMILVNGKTLELNTTAREIYLYMKEGISYKEIEDNLTEKYGDGGNYMQSIEKFMRMLLEYNVIKKIND